MNSADPRLRKLLGGAALDGLRARLRRHFERAAPDAPSGVLRLGSLSAAESEALALLTGRPPRQVKSMQIDVAALDCVLREAGIAGSLREALERIDGPIPHTAAMRAAALASWSTVVAGCAHPALADFLRAPAAAGLLKRLARQDAAAATQLLDQAASVLRRLPVAGLARAQLAAETLGNAHALDNGQPVATLVLAAWRQYESGRPQRSGSPDAQADAPGNAVEERLRDVWARAGVLVNELARPALFLNLPVQTGAMLPAALGEPGYLSLRRLLRAPPWWAVADVTVYVCENPNLVAIAADCVGTRCAPLVCTDGMPAAAQRTLLAQLAQAGALLCYHGDFDWPGLRIANHVMRTWEARPWRFMARDYEAAVTDAPQARHDLDGAGATASWDDALAPAMRRHGVAIAEEGVAALLLEDLGRHLW